MKQYKAENTESPARYKVSRRSFIKSSLAGGAALFSLPLINACNQDTRVLRVANWADLIATNTIADFEREAKCSVIYENYSANEDLFQKVSMNPNNYDVVFPSDYMVEQLYRKGMLSPLPHDKFKNLDNLDKRLTNHEYDPDNQYSFPYTYWGTGIAVNKARFQIDSGREVQWEDLFSSKAAGRVTVLNEMRYTLGMALLMNGRSVNTDSPEDIDLAVKSLKKLKPSIMAFVTDVKDLLTRGETSLSYAYSGDVNQASSTNANIVFQIPRGGGIVGIDNMCITANTRNKELAIEFLDYLMSPKVAASLTNEMFYATANRAAVEQHLIQEDLLKNPVIFLPIGNSPHLNVLRYLDDPRQQIYVNAWDQVKRA
jgi:spermidine/putrescine transport system substrate-binding protein